MSTNLPRNFKGIWIPKEIWLHNELSFFEKCLWAEINSLDDEERGCTASNEYLCKIFNIHEKTLQRGLAKLKSLKFVYVEKFDGRERSLRAPIKDIFVTSDPTPPKQQDTIKDIFVTPEGTDLSTTHIYREKKEEKKESPPIPQGGEDLPKVRSNLGTSEDSKEIVLDLWKRIQNVHPKSKKPDFKKWELDIDRAMKIDCRSKEELFEAIRFAFEESPFWVKVIQSAESLRRNFDKIWTAKKPIENRGTRIQQNMQTALKMKQALSSSGEESLLLIYKESVTNQKTGDSVKMDLPTNTFEEILLTWTGLRKK